MSKPPRVLVALLSSKVARALAGYPDLVVTRAPLPMSLDDIALARLDCDLIVVDATFLGLIREASRLGLAIVALGDQGSEERNEEMLVAAFEAGADDFMVPPIDFEELRARILGITRRLTPAIAGPPAAFGPLVLHEGGSLLTCGAKEISLGRCQVIIVRELLKAQGMFVSRDVLVRHFRDNADDLGSLRDALHEIRGKFTRKEVPAKIDNQPGVGYRLLLTA